MRTLIYTLLLLFRHGATEGREISCVAGETAVGCTAIVTCDFGRNIRDIKQTFMIFKYPPGTYNFNSDLRKDVMSCNWNSEQSLNCYVESPFVAHITSLQSVQSNGVINYTKKTSGIFESQSVVSDSSSIVVEISNVTNEHAGIYECQLVSTAYISSTKCLLTVSETWGNRPLTDLCQDNRKPDADTSTLDKTGLIFGSFGFGFGFLFIFILFWICLKRRSDLSPGEHDAWDDVICCRLLQRLRKPEGSAGGGSPSKSESPEEEKLNPRRGDRSLPFDDVDDTDENNTSASKSVYNVPTDIQGFHPLMFMQTS